MGIAALNFPEGTSKSKTAIMKLILLTALAAVALAEPEADAYYGYGGYYGHGLYGYGYGHQLGWPSYRAPGFESTVWGARGKRSAEPSAEPRIRILRLPSLCLWPLPPLCLRTSCRSCRCPCRCCWCWRPPRWCHFLFSQKPPRSSWQEV